MRKPICMDLEVYRNYLLIQFRGIESGKVKRFEMYDGHRFNAADLIKILRTYQIITFNGYGYDIPLVLLSLLQTTTNMTLKNASDDIIVRQMKPWQVAKKYKSPEVDFFDHIDLIEVAPGQASLKIYGGRLHSKRLQDLPIEPDALITPEQRDILREYCENDLVTTTDLYHKLRPALELRDQMSSEYGIDLRSKSDAQIAEAVIRSQIEKIRGEKLARPELPSDYSFYYEPPRFIIFESAQLNEILETVQTTPFTLSDKGSVQMPSSLESANIKLGNGVYRMGIGGLHSSEQSSAHVSDENTVLEDWDVNSYYPAIILGCDLSPEHLGDDFLNVYRKIVNERLLAKKRVGELKKEIAAVKVRIEEVKTREKS